MATIIDNLSYSRVKSENSFDSITDLEARLDGIDAIEKWHDEISRRIHHSTQQENEKMVDDMMIAYYRSVKDKIVSNKDKSLLKLKVLAHIRHFYLYYKGIGHAIVDTNYFTRMEDLLTYYCNLELELVYHFSKQRENKKYFLFVIKRLCKVLGIYFHHKLRYILHVLLKVKYNVENITSQMVMRQIYSHFLTRLPPEPFSDEVFCRYYLAFQRYKEVARPEDKERLGDVIFHKFAKPRDFLTKSPIMKTVLSPPCGSLPDAITQLLDFKTRAIDSYFTYLKNQLEETARLVSDIDARSSPSDFGNTYADLFATFAASEPLCIDSDSDIEAIEEEGTIVLSDEDGIEIIYKEKDIRKKHRKKTKSVAEVISLDSDDEQPTTDIPASYPVSTAPVSNSAAIMISEDTTMSTSASVVMSPVPSPAPSDHTTPARTTETRLLLDASTSIERFSNATTPASTPTTETLLLLDASTSIESFSKAIAPTSSRTTDTLLLSDAPTSFESFSNAIAPASTRTTETRRLLDAPTSFESVSNATAPDSTRTTETRRLLDASTSIESFSNVIAPASSRTPALISSVSQTWTTYRSPQQSCSTEGSKSIFSLSLPITTPSVFNTMPPRDRSKDKNVTPLIQQTLLSLLKLRLNEDTNSNQSTVKSVPELLPPTTSPVIAASSENSVMLTSLTVPLSERNELTKEVANSSVIATISDEKITNQSTSPIRADDELSAGEACFGDIHLDKPIKLRPNKSEAIHAVNTDLIPRDHINEVVALEGLLHDTTVSANKLRTERKFKNITPQEELPTPKVKVTETRRKKTSSMHKSVRNRSEEIHVVNRDLRPTSPINEFAALEGSLRDTTVSTNKLPRESKSKNKTSHKECPPLKVKVSETKCKNISSPQKLLPNRSEAIHAVNTDLIPTAPINEFVASKGSLHDTTGSANKLPTERKFKNFTAQEELRAPKVKVAETKRKHMSSLQKLLRSKADLIPTSPINQFVGLEAPLHDTTVSANKRPTESEFKNITSQEELPPSKVKVAEAKRKNISSLQKLLRSKADLIPTAPVNQFVALEGSLHNTTVSANKRHTESEFKNITSQKELPPPKVKVAETKRKNISSLQKLLRSKADLIPTAPINHQSVVSEGSLHDTNKLPTESECKNITLQEELQPPKVPVAEPKRKRRSSLQMLRGSGSNLPSVPVSLQTASFINFTLNGSFIPSPLSKLITRDPESILSMKKCTPLPQKVTEQKSVSESEFKSNATSSDLYSNVLKSSKATLPVTIEEKMSTASSDSFAENTSQWIKPASHRCVPVSETTRSFAICEQPLANQEQTILPDDETANTVLVPIVKTREPANLSVQRESDEGVILSSTRYKLSHSINGCESDCVICGFDYCQQRESCNVEKLKITPEPLYKFGIITPPTDSRFDESLADLENPQDIFDEQNHFKKVRITDDKCSLSNYYNTENQNDYSDTDIDLISKNSNLENSRLKNVIIEHVETIYDMNIPFGEMDADDNINDDMAEQIGDYSSEQNDVANTSELDIKDTIVQVLQPGTNSVSSFDFGNHDNTGEENEYRTNSDGAESEEFQIDEEEYAAFNKFTSSSMQSLKIDAAKGLDFTKPKMSKRRRAELERVGEIQHTNESTGSTKRNKPQKILFTSEAIKLDNFSKLDCDNNELENVLSGPVSDVSSQYYENSDGNFNLFGYADSVPPLLVMKLDKSKEIDSPAYNKMDSDDFKNYMQHEFPYNSAFKLSKSGGTSNDNELVPAKAKVTFNDIVDTHFITPNYTKPKNRKRKLTVVVRDGIKCYIDPADKKLNGDEFPKLVIHKISDNELLNKYRVVNHNTLRTCIRKKIDCSFEVNSGSTTLNNSRKKGMRDVCICSGCSCGDVSGGNSVAASVAFPDPASEFSNSPKYLPNLEELQECFENTFEADNLAQTAITQEISLLSDNSNCYSKSDSRKYQLFLQETVAGLDPTDIQEDGTQGVVEEHNAPEAVNLDTESSPVPIQTYEIKNLLHIPPEYISNLPADVPLYYTDPRASTSAGAIPEVVHALDGHSAYYALPSTYGYPPGIPTDIALYAYQAPSGQINLFRNINLPQLKSDCPVPTKCLSSPHKSLGNSSSGTDEYEYDVTGLYSVLTDTELNNLFHRLGHSDSENRLPFKKRRILVNVNDRKEISYPAKPMISIAEVEEMSKYKHFRTPAERKEMPPLPIFTNPQPSPIRTDQVNINNHTYNNPIINYHIPFLPCGTYFPISPIVLPFNNIPPFNQNPAPNLNKPPTVFAQPFNKPVKKENDPREKPTTSYSNNFCYK